MSITAAIVIKLGLRHRMRCGVRPDLTDFQDIVVITDGIRAPDNRSGISHSISYRHASQVNVASIRHKQRVIDDVASLVSDVTGNRCCFVDRHRRIGRRYHKPLFKSAADTASLTIQGTELGVNIDVFSLRQTCEARQATDAEFWNEEGIVASTTA